MKLFSTFVFAVFAAANLSADSIQLAQAAPEWDKLFQQTNGWIGADGDYSVRLLDNKILWLSATPGLAK